MKKQCCRRILAILVLVAMIQAAGCLSALTEGIGGILLPTPPPAEPTPTPEPALQIDLDPAETVQPVSDLPDPSYFLITTGTEQEAFLTIGESAYDARIYAVHNVGNAISDYLTACTEAGYNWEPSDIFTGYLAYRIFGGGKSAYFVPDYGTSLLLLVEQEMPVQEMKPAPEAYEKNKLLLSVNDMVFQTDYAADAHIWLVNSKSGYVEVSKDDYDPLGIIGNNIVFYSESAPYQLICIVIPKRARTSETYTMRRNASDSGIGFVMLNGFTPFDQGKINGEISVSNAVVMLGNSKTAEARIGLMSDSDYLSIQPIYINGNEFRGRVEGVFNDGSLRISGTFWVDQ